MATPESEWQELICDKDYISYGGSWWRQVSDTGIEVVEISNLDEDTSKDENACRYRIRAAEFDLEDSSMAEALESSGWSEDGDSEGNPLTISHRVQALYGYHGGLIISNVIVRGVAAAEAALIQAKL